MEKEILEIIRKKTGYLEMVSIGDIKAELNELAEQIIEELCKRVEIYKPRMDNVTMVKKDSI